MLAILDQGHIAHYRASVGFGIIATIALDGVHRIAFVIVQIHHDLVLLTKELDAILHSLLNQIAIQWVEVQLIFHNSTGISRELAVLIKGSE